MTRQITTEELAEQLMTVEDALNACFGNFEETENGYLKTTCCGEVKYGSGLFGPDIAKCTKCGRAIINVLSPHVSPFLVERDKAQTSMPGEKFIEAVGDRMWLVCLPKEESDNETS